jgi:toxin ParE1/3/4
MGETPYKVILSPRALRDLEEIVTYIAADDPQAAERFGGHLIDEAESIALHPLKGRAVPEFRDISVREWIFRFYRIVYRVDDKQRLIVVSRFWHAARGTPEIAGSV